MVDLATTKALVRDYTHAYAKLVLDRAAGVTNKAPTGSSVEKCVQLAQHLAKMPNGLSSATLQDIAVIVVSGTLTLETGDAQKIFANAFHFTPSLIRELEHEIIPGYISVLGTDSSIPANVIYNLLYCLRALLVLVPFDALEYFAQSKELVVGLARCYDSLLPSSATDVYAVRAKVETIDILHIIFNHLVESASSHNHGRQLFEILLAVLDRPVASTSFTPFSDRTLIGDYEASYHLSRSLSNLPSNVPDSRVRYIVSALKRNEGSAQRDDGSIGSLVALLNVGLSTTDTLGKGKAKEDAPAQGFDSPEMDVAVTQVLDILPDENPVFVRACLAHPSFAGSAELLIGALLEGTPLPDGLDAKRHERPEATDLPTASLVDSRRNAFDDDPLDFSRLRVGKKRDENADTVLHDKSFASNLKEEILRRAREQAEQDEEDEREARRGVRTVAFEDELGGDDLDSAPRIKLGNDGEDSDGEDAEDLGTKSTAIVENMLELAYIKDPKLFDRDASTRRSKARADLKAETGWGDEQIEGWRIMLERNPRKDRILMKHEFSGNKLLASEDESDASSPDRQGSTIKRGGSRGRARGRGGNRGGGGGSGGGSGSRGGGGGDRTARDRARKDKAGNQNRRRGHDKKMARGGAPPS